MPPVIEIDATSLEIGWKHALGPFKRAGSGLLQAFNREAEYEANPITWALAKRMAGAFHDLLGGVYSEDVKGIAAALDAPERDIVMANLAYELSHIGCSAFVVGTKRGPLHARNLDWHFPRNLLKKHVLIVRMHKAAAGDYSFVSWPGLFGVLTGLAKGRFSISVNHVRNSSDGGWADVLKNGMAGAWPVTWAVRRVFDTARSYEAAVRQLKTFRLISPAIFTVAGVRNQERIIIERSSESWSVRQPAKGESIVATNHYVCPEFHEENDDLEEMDTCERFDHLERQFSGRAIFCDTKSALRVLSHQKIWSQDTQHQVVMEPASGRLVVRIPGKRSSAVRL